MQSLKKEATKGDGTLVIVRASKLAEEGRTGTVAQGILEKTEPNKFNPANKDYFIRDVANDTLYILNGTSGLNEQLGQDGVVGTMVRVDYEGKLKTKSGKGYHSFSCFSEPVKAK